MMADKNEHFTFQVEQFPDGVYGVPVIFDGESVNEVGSALVTFKDGLWAATIQLTDETIRELGVQIRFETHDSLVGVKKAVILKPHEDVDFVRELRKRWR